MVCPRRRDRRLCLPHRRFLSIIVALGSLTFATAAGAQTYPAPDDGDVADAVDTFDLTGLQSRFQSIADKVSPAVVSISAIDEKQDSLLPSAEMNPDKLQEILDQNTRTVGTGFIVDASGWILTNEHVIGQAQQLWVTTSDRKVWPALVVGSDPRADVAVLKIPAAGLAAVKFAEPGAVRRGQWTIALGNPYGLAVDGQSCMSVGVISALDRSLARLAAKEDRLYSHLIETTAQINPGNSGGPLFDLNGQVIGINTAVILPQKTTNGIGFAIPVNGRLLDEVRDLEQGRQIVYGYLGVTVAEPTPREREDAGVGQDVGVRVTSTEPDSPASALLRPDDLLVNFNDQTLADTDQFVRLVGAAAVGKAASVRVWREGKMMTLNVVPTSRPTELTAVSRDSQRLKWRGMLLGPAPRPARGLLVLACDEDCPCKASGVKEGSIIETVAGRSVATLIDLLAVMNELPPEKCDVGVAPALPAVSAAATQGIR
jgi:serine protease Do